MFDLNIQCLISFQTCLQLNFVFNNYWIRLNEQNIQNYSDPNSFNIPLSFRCHDRFLAWSVIFKWKQEITPQTDKLELQKLRLICSNLSPTILFASA
jgi:hypothetical protein